MTGSACPQYGTLEVAVLDERDGRVVGTADVVALRIDVLGEVEDVLGGADDLACADARREPAGRGGRPPNASAAPAPLLASTPSFASSSRSPLNARLEISSETVNPIPATHAPPASTGQLIGGRGPWSTGRDAIQVAPRIPTGLPTT